MPDISMCIQHGCEKKDKCYRYTAKPNPFRQTYGGFTAKDCKYFWDNSDE